jgi:hypothetical protein
MVGFKQQEPAPEAQPILAGGESHRDMRQHVFAPFQGAGLSFDPAPLRGNAIKLRGRLKDVSSPRVSKGLILLALPHHRATDTQLNLMALPPPGRERFDLH